MTRVQYLRLVLAVGFVTCFACLYGPPIEERPIDWDDPPWIDDNQGIGPPNIDPSADEILSIDRFLNEAQSFGVREIRDPDPPEEIAYEFSIIWLEGPVSDQLVLESGRLIVDEERTSELQGTVYGSVDYTLDLCSEELRAVEQAVFRLELTDPIPSSQWAALGTDRFVVTVDWTMEFPPNDCAAR